MWREICTVQYERPYFLVCSENRNTCFISLQYSNYIMCSCVCSTCLSIMKELELLYNRNYISVTSPHKAKWVNDRESDLTGPATYHLTWGREKSGSSYFGPSAMLGLGINPRASDTEHLEWILTCRMITKKIRSFPPDYTILFNTLSIYSSQMGSRTQKYCSD